MLVVQAGLAVAGWMAGWVLLWCLPRLSRPPSCAPDDARPGDGPSVGSGNGSRRPVVVVPARDEEATLPRLLDSLAAQRPPAARVVVVDDGSADATAHLAAARDPAERVRLVSGRPPPDGWTGKAWALHQGVEAADLDPGDVVVFLDADVTLAPGALEALAGELGRRGGLVSVAPHHRVVRPLERVSALFNLVAMMGIGAAWPGRRGRSAGANGACLACRTADYRRAGGHARTPGDVADDLALAASFDRVGLPVWCLAGADLVAYRMYRDWPALVEGWSKNMAAGASRTPVRATLAVVLWLSSMLATVPLLVGGLAGGLPGGQSGGLAGAGSTAGAAIGAAGYVAYAVQLHVHLRRLGSFGAATPWAHPLLAVLFVAIFVRSALLAGLRREVRWRGRAVPVGGRGEGA